MIFILWLSSVYYLAIASLKLDLYSFICNSVIISEILLSILLLEFVWYSRTFLLSLLQCFLFMYITIILKGFWIPWLCFLYSLTIFSLGNLFSDHSIILPENSRLMVLSHLSSIPLYKCLLMFLKWIS